MYSALAAVLPNERPLVQSTAENGSYRLLGYSKLIRGFPNVSEASSVLCIDDAGRHTLVLQTS